MIDLLYGLIQSSELAQLAVILVVVIGVSGLATRLKQPLIIGYLLAGVLVGPLALGLIEPSVDGHSFLELFSHLGISLLLFMVGTGLNLTEIKEQGKVALGVGLLQIVVSIVSGFGVSYVLGYDVMTSVFVAFALTFSSTIVIVKLLSDKDEEDSMYGKMSIGVLIVQDLVVMILLMLVAVQGGSGGGSVMVLEGLSLITLTVLFARYVLPVLVRWLARHEELLLLTGIGWCLLLGTLFQVVGFSFEIGCLLAGMSFANSPFRMYITSKLRSLRDFFLVLFFIALGLKLSRAGLADHFSLLVAGLVVVMVIKPLVVYVVSGWFGYTHQVSMKAGMSLGQISEFGFLVLGIGLSAGYVTDESLMSVMVLIGLISIGVSSYVTMNNDLMFAGMQRWLGRESVGSTEELLVDALTHVEIILFGYGRIGSALSDDLDRQSMRHIVIDHNPLLIDHLEEREGDYIFADATSVEIYSKLFHRELKMVVTTIRDLEDDLFIIKQVQAYNPDIIIVVVSNKREHALQLYDAGADYVIMPEVLGVKHTSALIEELGFNLETFVEEKLRHVDELRKGV